MSRNNDRKRQWPIVDYKLQQVTDQQDPKRFEALSLLHDVLNLNLYKRNSLKNKQKSMKKQKN